VKLAAAAPLAAASGALLILAFPKPDLPLFAWIGLVPLLWLCHSEPRARRRFLLGWIAGAVFFLGSCYWCFGVMRDYGGLSDLQSAGVLAAMVAGLALYWGVFSAVLPAFLFEERPALTILAVAALWTAVEFARGHVFIGFPWLLFGYAATDIIVLAKLAQVTGVWGLSFIVAAFNTMAFLVARDRDPRKARPVAAGFLALAALTAANGQFGPSPASGDAYLLQTALPLDEPAARRQAALDDIQRLLLIRYAEGGSRSGLVVWPETPEPFYYHEDPRSRAYFALLARQTDSFVFANTVAFERGDRRRPLNSVVAVGPDGAFRGQYDKMHLVPFGEHVPYARLFAFAGKLTAEVGDFVPGSRPVVLPAPQAGRAATPICYEAGFPGLVRRFTQGGAQLLVNLSNDGWFGDSAARRQHLLMARMRAIENDRWLLRATNDGLTAAIDPLGRATVFEPGKRAVYQARYARRSSLTLYARLGDWFPLACAGWASLRLYLARKEEQDDRRTGTAA
jgi:apolipoprotein N-acyltransferase